jgi:hypothetical protein
MRTDPAYAQRYVSVESASRDRSRWPSDSQFSADLESEYRGVQSFHVLDGVIPAAFGAAQGTNSLEVSLPPGSPFVEVSAPAPHYTSDADLGPLLAALEADSTAKGVPLTATVAADGRVTLASVSGTAFVARPPRSSAGYRDGHGPDSVMALLGFPEAGESASDATGVLTAPIPNTANEPIRVYLQVDGIGRVETVGESPASLSSTQDVVVSGRPWRSQSDPVLTRFNPPMGRMHTLKITLSDRYGRVVNTSGRGVWLLISVVVTCASSWPGIGP